MYPTPNRHPEAGLTLIEVMIAIVILATISLMAWRGLDTLTRANTTIQMRSEESARLMGALQQLDRDIAQRTTIELPPEQGQAVAPPEQQSGPAPAAPQRPVALLPTGMDIREDAQTPLRIALLRAAPAAPGQWQQVEWWVQGDTLYRAAGKVTSRYPIPAPESGDRVAVLNGVASLSVRAWVPGTGWQVLPDERRASALATGLEFTLGIRRSAGPPWLYRRVVAFN